MDLYTNAKIQNRYLVLSLIDKGGMGEVYQAKDTQLGRKVALKLLKKTDDPENIKRFRQEAKIISSLNHPNILTVYDSGQHENFYFIISELIEGETLRKVLATRNLVLAEVLNITIQVGKALIAAHKAGVIHRDLKPENIMVLPDDNHIKVLDFGLAKLSDTENNLTQNPDETTASIFQTKDGLVAGTVYYMSPEQIRGHITNETTDIWSLGVVLYELLTKQRPFSEDNKGDIIVSILDRPAPSVLKVNPNLPIEIDAIITKALVKEKEKRFRDVKEFVDALLKLRSNIESTEFLEVGNEPKSTITNEARRSLPTYSNQEKITQLLGLKSSLLKISRGFWSYLLAFVTLSIISAGALFYLYSYTAEPEIIKQFKVKRLPTAGNISNGVISPDGRFVAFVQNDNGKQSLWLRLVNEVAGKELIAPSSTKYSGLSFSPDGNFIFFTSFAGKASSILYKISILGGNPQEIIRDVDSTVSFSPDGSKFAFIRIKSREGLNQIVISNINSSGERIISETKQPKFYAVSTREGLTWSPDGKFLVCPLGQRDDSGEFMNLAEIDIENGTEKVISDYKWLRIGRIIWLKDSDNLILTVSESASAPFHIVKLHRISGRKENITSDLNDYLNISTTSNSDRLLGLIFDTNSNVFTSTIKIGEQARQLTGGGFDGIGGLSWTADGKIIFVSVESSNRDIWQMDSSGGNRRQLTFDASSEEFPVVSKDGKYIVFVSDRTGISHIWRMNSDGTDLKQLTDGTGETFPQITPDGNWIIYSARLEGRIVLWKTSIEGKDTVQITDEQTHWASISPDGKIVACLGRENTAEAPIKLVLISTDNGRVINRFALTGEVASPTITPVLRWTPDNQAVTYISTQNNVSNIFAQSIKGGVPQKITDFSADRIFSFDWSKDGKSIAFARGVMRTDLILMENF